MSIQNKKSIALLPVIFALLLILGIIIGVKLSSHGLNDRLLIYPQNNKLNNILDLIDDTYVDSVSRDTLEETAIHSILKTLDPHSIYIPAKDLQAVNEPLEGNFSGIGVYFNFQNDTLIVVSTIAKGPSEIAGIRPGDRIVRVNDTIVAGVKIRNDQVVKKLKGNEGTYVKITILRPDDKKLYSFKVKRSRIPLKSIDIAYIAQPGIGYIKLTKFAKTTFDEFKEAISDLTKKGLKNKLIIDLRGNGGGLLTAATDIADQFLDGKQLIVYTQGKSRRKTETFSKPSGLCVHYSLVLLMDEYSASASEVLAGALQDNDRATVIGRRSFGKGLVQEQVQLPDGSAIRLTIARYYTPTGRSIQKSYASGSEKYYEEIDERINHGELEQKDSIHFNESLKFTTPKGKVVYGGGGIMPDIFIPLDTSAYSPSYRQLTQKGIIYRFAFFYSDKYRSNLKKCKNWGELNQLLLKGKIIEELIQYARKQGLIIPKADIQVSGAFIENQLIAYICRNFFDDDGFYPILLGKDKNFIKALEVLK